MANTIKRSKFDHTAKNKRKQIKVNGLKSLRKIREDVAGIDVGSEFHYVAAPDPSNNGSIVVCRFGSFTPHLKECVDWLKQCNIASVAMEATGVYWTILYTMLEEAGIEVLLVNPRDFKKLKDKKTDVCDAEFLQLYHSYGLFEGAVIPERKISELRTFTRLREQSIEDAATCIQRMQKALINMNLRLDNVLEDISGATGMAIIRAIIGGERDPKKLATLRDKRCKKTIEEIEDSLNGFYQEDHLFALERAVRQYEFHLAELNQCDAKIQAKLNEFASNTNYKEAQDASLDATCKCSKTGCKRKGLKKPHEFTFDLSKEITRITGVDLTQLPGIGPSTALTLIAEIGLDMSRWESTKEFVSWLGLAPNNKISGGKILNKRTKKKKKKAAIVLRMAVSGLYHEANDTAIGAFYRRKRGQIGPAKAITAAARKLACNVYTMLATGKSYVEIGAEGYRALQKEKHLRRIRKQVAEWGYNLTPVKAAV
jgi:transposase